jgi:hypothetical protein
MDQVFEHVQKHKKNIVIVLMIICLLIIMVTSVQHYANNNKIINMNYKLEKYQNKLNGLNVYYHFNTYGREVPTKYSNLLDLIKSKFSYIKEATREEHSLIGKATTIVTLCKDDHYARYKFSVGSNNIIFTLFIRNNDSIESAMNIMLTNEGVYIETYCGFSTNLLLNILKEICKESNINKIETYSMYQLETDFLLTNEFVGNNNELIFNV